LAVTALRLRRKISAAMAVTPVDAELPAALP